jgi:hypothetical protein
VNEYWILLLPADDVFFVLAGQNLATMNDGHQLSFTTQ